MAHHPNDEKSRMKFGYKIVYVPDVLASIEFFEQVGSQQF
jgi:hypothetical protein